MKLKDYLTKIKECPDELVDLDGEKIPWLTCDFGICNNYPIFVKANPIELRDFLIKSDRFQYLTEIDEVHFLHYLPRPIGLQIFDYVRSSLGTKTTRKMFEINYHTTRQNTNHSSTITIQCKEVDSSSGLLTLPQTRDLAMALEDVALAFANDIPICFPRSIGWKNPNDLSRIVYSPDSVDNEMRKRILIRKQKGEQTK